MRERDVFTPLRTRADYHRISTQGRRKSDAVLQVRVLKRPAPDKGAGSLVRLGITAGKRFGNAVERNRFKRLVRAAMRELAPELTPGWDIMVLPREAHGVKMQAMHESLRALLGALGVLRRNEAPDAGGVST